MGQLFAKNDNNFLISRNISVDDTLICVGVDNNGIHKIKIGNDQNAYIIHKTNKTDTKLICEFGENGFVEFIKNNDEIHFNVSHKQIHFSGIVNPLLRRNKRLSYVEGFGDDIIDFVNKN